MTTMVSLPLTMPLLLLLLLPLLLLPTTTTITHAQLLTKYRPLPFQSSLLSSDCSLCLSAEDTESCQRCLESRAFLAEDSNDDDDDADQDVLAVSKKWASYQPMRRYQRGSGCSCCYFSRMTNAGCCAACSMTTKKRAAGATKRSSGGGMTSEGDDALLTSERGPVQLGSELARSGRANCWCCFVTGDQECCARCMVFL
ncbi:hypothetical protein ACOMHN_011420 [Nucella lapillus]